MKKRDLFWTTRLICFFAIILLFTFLFFHHIIQFNSSYIQEEKDELNVFRKQIQWAVTPYLEKEDMESLKKYAEDFEGSEVKFRVFDKNGNIIVSSNPEDLTPMAKDDSKVLRKKTPWKIYKSSIKDRKIVSVAKFNAGMTEYYIELTLLQEKVIEKIVKGQINMITLFIFSMLILLLAIFQLIYQVRSSFNKFDNCVLKIANGDLDTVIEVPELEMLNELAISVKKMTERLKKQIVRLEQLEEYKNEFIQNASHEIKTPITAINMALELSENSNNEEQNRECFKIIQYQIKAINKLVNDILMLSEIDVEKTNEQKSFEKFNLNELIQKVVSSFGNNEVKINIQCDKSVIFNGNEDLIKSALENLITNAVRYSGSDKIDIILTQDESGIKIQVKDYGKGIKKEHLDKIFEKFYRIDKTRSRKKGGTGLGLAIVKNIVELHSGEICVESEENKGTNFVIKLPVTL